MALYDNRIPVKGKFVKETSGYREADVQESIRKLKTLGLKKTPYPKYLLLTLEDLKEVFGDALLGDRE